MSRLPRYAGQAVFYGAIAALIGYFASRPAYEQFPPDKAQIKLSLTHGAARKEACRRLTAQEIAKLPRKERRVSDCSGERLPVHVEILVDDEVLYAAALPPTGLAGDGPSRAYEKLVVPAGRHEIVARLRDSNRAEGFDFEGTARLELAPQQNLAIDFQPEAGGFLFR
jgi:hypothetical protein